MADENEANEVSNFVSRIIKFWPVVAAVGVLVAGVARQDTQASAITGRLDKLDVRVGALESQEVQLGSLETHAKDEEKRLDHIEAQLDLLVGNSYRDGKPYK